MSFSSPVFFKLKIRNQTIKTPDKEPDNQQYSSLTPIYQFLLLTPPAPPQTKKRRRGDKIMVGKVVKAKVGDLEENIREVFSRRLMKESLVCYRRLFGKGGIM